jgi:porin
MPLHSIMRRLACFALLTTTLPAQSPTDLVDRQDAAGAHVSKASSWLAGETATGEWWGLRTRLEERGLEIFGGYTAEVWDNTTGGRKRGAVYTGLLDFGVNLDLEEALGWKGASMNTTWLWLSGRDASEDLAGNFLTISNIAGFNTLRLLELWFQQNLLDDRISVRFGQITADSEFVISDYAGTFINGTFGWPAFLYMNLPAGGPGYPMGTLGVRLALHPVDWFTFQSAVFQGNVYDQNVNRHGFRWRLDGENGFYFLNEAQVRWNHRAEEPGLPGQAKAGMWMQTGRLADVLADTTNSGNYGWYFIVDQMLHRETPAVPAPAGGQSGEGKAVRNVRDGKSFGTPVEKSAQGLGWFGRIAFAPEDRNFLNFYFDTGFTYQGLLPTRDNDVIGIAFAFAQPGATARRSLVDEGSVGVGAEMVLEATYQAQITPWLIIQPDLQFIIHPGGTRDFGNAFVVGARAAITF